MLGIALVILIFSSIMFFAPNLLGSLSTQPTCPSASITVTPTAVTPGGSVTVTGTGFLYSDEQVYVFAMTGQAGPQDKYVAISRFAYVNQQGSFNTVLAMTSPSGTGYQGPVRVIANDQSNSYCTAYQDISISSSGSTTPAPNPTIAVSSNTINPGGSITVTGTGFSPNQQGTISVYFDQENGLGSPNHFAVSTNAAGSFSVSEFVQASWVVFPPPNNLKVYAIDYNLPASNGGAGGISNIVLVTVNTGIAPSTITVFVQVFDQQDFPIVGASVSLSSTSAVTDSYGAATLHLTSTGSYTLTVSASGFVTLNKAVSITGASTIPVNLVPSSSGGGSTSDPPIQAGPAPTSILFINGIIVPSASMVTVVSPVNFTVLIESTTPAVNGVRVIVDGATYSTSKTGANTYQSAAITLPSTSTHTVHFEYLDSSQAWSSLALLSIGGRTGTSVPFLLIAVVIGIVVVSLWIVVWRRRS